MSKSMLTSVRNAFSGQANLENPETGERGDEDSPSLTSQNRSETMSETNSAPAAKAQTGTTQVASVATVEAARAEGVAEGATAANNRLSSVMSADGIKGDGPRMSAALDLAVKSPSMSAEDVVSFVSANVKAGGGTTLTEFESGRVDARTPPAQPQGGNAKEPTGLSKLIGARIERMPAR